MKTTFRIKSHEQHQPLTNEQTVPQGAITSNNTSTDAMSATNNQSQNNDSKVTPGHNQGQGRHNRLRHGCMNTINLLNPMIDRTWPNVIRSLSYPNRISYAEFLNKVSGKRAKGLFDTLFHTIRAGLLEGKTNDELLAEISPLICGYPQSERVVLAQNTIGKVVTWLKKGATSTAPLPPKHRPKRRGSISATPNPPVSSPSSPAVNEWDHASSEEGV
jgi:hypothetical protein